MRVWSGPSGRVVLANKKAALEAALLESCALELPRSRLSLGVFQGLVLAVEPS